MKKISYYYKKGCVYIEVDGALAGCFRASTDLEGKAHLRAFILGLRWGRDDEFDPVTEHKSLIKRIVGR